MKDMRGDKYNVSDMLVDIPRGGICVEVGTYIGESAVLFAQHFDQVVCVDSWDYTQDYEPIKNEFIRRTSAFSNIAYLHMPSRDAAEIIPDDSIYAVYIDADHSYQAVKDDIILWEPKVKRGGYITGHDYEKKRFPGCVAAVNELLGRPTKVYRDDSWIIRKK